MRMHLHYKLLRSHKIYSKRSGLEKAIHQVEQALKRSKGNGVTFDAEKDIDLRRMIQPSRQHELEEVGLRNGYEQSRHADYTTPLTTAATIFDDSALLDQTEKPDDLALNNADNPLQLLALASSMPSRSPNSVIDPSPAAAASTSDASDNVDDAVLQLFFSGLTSVLDNLPKYDPVELGLVTTDEAERLFNL